MGCAGNTTAADALDEGWGVVKDRSLQSAREGADSDVLRTGDLGELAEQSFGYGPCKQQGHGTKSGLGVNEARILAEIAGQFSNHRIVEAGNRGGTGPEWFPILQVVPEMQVKIQIRIEQQDVIRKRREAIAQGGTVEEDRIFGPGAVVWAIDLDWKRLVDPIRFRQIFQGLLAETFC